MMNTRRKPKKPKMSISQASIDHQSTQPEDVIGSNDDLLTEILLRLPVTSILRFKSVSKHWLSLLTHTHFTHRYDTVSKSPGIFARNIYIPFDVETPNPPPFHGLYRYFKRPGVVILQACNGLLLCSTDRGPKGRLGVNKYYVFNPTTKQLAIIPPVPGGPKVRDTICYMSLAFEQTLGVHFKVVCVRLLDEYNTGLFQIQIYSSDTRKWKVSVESFSAKLRYICPGVYWNGSIYWTPFNDNSKYVRYNLDHERMETLPVPVGLISSEIMTMELGESRGHLHLIAYMDHHKNRLGVKVCEMLRVNVYEMLSDCSGWFVKYQLQLDEIYGAYPGMISRYSFFKVVDLVRGEEEEDTVMVLKCYDKIITYNVHDKSFKQIFSVPCGYEVLTSFPRYTETLTIF